jgi:hypothetical protein
MGEWSVLGGWVNTPFYYAMLGALCGVVGFRMCRRSNNHVALPVIQALVGFLAFASSWRVGGTFAGALAVGGWVLGTAPLAIHAFRGVPDEPLPRWWRLAGGRRSRPLGRGLSRLAELTACAAASFVSAGAASMVLLAVLVDRAAWYNARRLAARSAIADALQLASAVLLVSVAAAPLGSRAGFPVVMSHLGWLLAAGGAAGLAAVAVDLFPGDATETERPETPGDDKGDSLHGQI